MAEPRIQLWTDDSNSEFAIFLNSDYMIRTNQKAKYTKVIDESICMQGYDYDWKHTLSQWVTFLFGNQFPLPDNLDISNSKQQPADSDQTKNKFKRIRVPRPHNLLRSSKRKLISKPKPNATLRTKLIKCNYCNLKFCIDEERNEHEKFWHSEKITTH